MQPNKVYDEVIEIIASSSPQNVIAFRPPDEVKARIADLIFLEKTKGLSEAENSELDLCLQIEHLMRMAKRSGSALFSRSLMRDETTR
jgi:hypothetical protein